MNSISIPSDTHHKREPMPAPSAVIAKIPVVVRDRMAGIKMPVEYQEACKALEACASIDEGKFWADKADALAAWAKIYKSDEAALAARRLKLQAFRRMGEIAETMEAERIAALRAAHTANAPQLEVERLARREQCREIYGSKSREYRNAAAALHRTQKRPDRGAASYKEKAAFKPQPITVMKRAGLTQGQASQATATARLPEPTFKKMIADGASLTRVQNAATGLGMIPASSAAYRWTMLTSEGPRLGTAYAAFKRRSAGDVAAGLTVKEADEVRPKVIELIEWLDAFEQALPKG